MKKIYIDKTQLKECTSVYVKDAVINWAGAVVCSMSVKHKNSEYQRYANEYDIHFIFDDNIPKLDFYTIPMIEIFATDSAGGYLGSLGEGIDFEGTAPICYIDNNQNCFLIADNGREFLNNAAVWKSHLTPCEDVELFVSIEDAISKYEFLDINEIQ